MIPFFLWSGHHFRFADGVRGWCSRMRNGFPGARQRFQGRGSLWCSRVPLCFSDAVHVVDESKVRWTNHRGTLGIYIAMMFLDSCCVMDDHEYYKYNILYISVPCFDHSTNIHIIYYIYVLYNIMYRIAGWWFFKHVLFSEYMGQSFPLTNSYFQDG